MPVQLLHLVGEIAGHHAACQERLIKPAIHTLSSPAGSAGSPLHVIAQGKDTDAILPKLKR